MGFSVATINSLKSKLDIAEIIGQYMDLRQTGTGLVGLCPFHSEKTGSFHVHPERGFYHCFGCQASGDVIEFYKQINGLSFVEAVEQLAQEANITLENTGIDSSKNQSEKTVCLNIHAILVNFYKAELNKAASLDVQNYLKNRKLTPEIISNFHLGWATNAWQSAHDFLRKNKFTDQDGLQAGILSKNTKGDIYDRFRARIIFPIYNLAGQVIAFGGRAIYAQDEPKYLNSSDTPIYQKSDHLYGLYQARKYISQSKTVILTEGYVDVLSLVQFGFTNSCGVLGTALTKEQTNRLASLAQTIYLIFDGDEAGQKASFRSAEMLLARGLKCLVVCLPINEDADSILQKYGQEYLQNLLDKAEDGLDFCMRILRNRQVPREIMDWAIGFMNKLEDIAWQALYIPKIIAGLGLSEVQFRANLYDKLEKKRFEILDKNEDLNLTSYEKQLLTFLLQCPEYIEKMRTNHPEIFFVSSYGKKLWEKLIKPEEPFLHGLDIATQNFFYKVNLLPKPNCQAIWEDLLKATMQYRLQKQQKILQQALGRAQEINDMPEIKRILNVLKGLRENSSSFFDC